jgi:hypothetical protein
LIDFKLYVYWRQLFCKLQVIFDPIDLSIGDSFFAAAQLKVIRDPIDLFENDLYIGYWCSVAAQVSGYFWSFGPID